MSQSETLQISTPIIKEKKVLHVDYYSSTIVETPTPQTPKVEQVCAPFCKSKTKDGRQSKNQSNQKRLSSKSSLNTPHADSCKASKNPECRAEAVKRQPIAKTTFQTSWQNEESIEQVFNNRQKSMLSRYFEDEELHQDRYFDFKSLVNEKYFHRSLPKGYKDALTADNMVDESVMDLIAESCLLNTGANDILKLRVEASDSKQSGRLHNESKRAGESESESPGLSARRLQSKESALKSDSRMYESIRFVDNSSHDFCTNFEIFKQKEADRQNKQQVGVSSDSDSEPQNSMQISMFEQYATENEDRFCSKAETAQEKRTTDRRHASHSTKRVRYNRSSGGTTETKGKNLKMQNDSTIIHEESDKDSEQDNGHFNFMNDEMAIGFKRSKKPVLEDQKDSFSPMSCFRAANKTVQKIRDTHKRSSKHTQTFRSTGISQFDTDRTIENRSTILNPKTVAEREEISDYKHKSVTFQKSSIQSRHKHNKTSISSRQEKGLYRSLVLSNGPFKPLTDDLQRKSQKVSELFRKTDPNKQSMKLRSRIHGLSQRRAMNQKAKQREKHSILDIIGSQNILRYLEKSRAIDPKRKGIFELADLSDHEKFTMSYSKYMQLKTKRQIDNYAYENKVRPKVKNMEKFQEFIMQEFPIDSDNKRKLRKIFDQINYEFEMVERRKKVEKR